FLRCSPCGPFAGSTRQSPAPACVCCACDPEPCASDRPTFARSSSSSAVAPDCRRPTSAMLGTLDPPRDVAIPGGDSPQRHKLPAPFRQTVIARCRSLAQRAAPANTAMRRDPDLNEVRLPLVAVHLYLFIDEARKTLYSIQDGFNLQLNS